MKNFLNKRYAFTLAEVLITTTIVGVVAAMTIPAISQMYNNHITEVRLKKFYADFNNAIKLSEIDNGPYQYWDFWSLPNNMHENLNGYKNAIKKYFFPYMKISRCFMNNMSPNRLVCEFPNGSAIAFLSNHFRDIYYFPKNWKKCMNKPSNGPICEFSFSMVPNPTSGWEYVGGKGLTPFLYAWDGTEEKLHSGNGYSCTENTTSRGLNYCTQIIKMNNWKIPKDFPKKISY